MSMVDYLYRSVYGSELINKIPGVNILLYDELKKYKSIEELLRKHPMNIILYQTNTEGDSAYGHWVALFRTAKGGAEFFDSYGTYPDDDLSQTIYKDCDSCDYLSQLLLKYMDNGGVVEYNDHKLQGPTTATCGKHVFARLLNKDMPIDDYKTHLDQLKKIYGSYDQVVHQIYNNY